MAKHDSYVYAPSTVAAISKKSEEPKVKGTKILSICPDAESSPGYLPQEEIPVEGWRPYFCNRSVDTSHNWCFIRNLLLDL